MPPPPPRSSTSGPRSESQSLRTRSPGTVENSPRLSIRPPDIAAPAVQFDQMPASERSVYERRLRQLEAQVTDVTQHLSQALGELIDTRQSRQREINALQRQISDLIQANQRLSLLASERKGALERAVRLQVGKELARQLDTL